MRQKQLNYINEQSDTQNNWRKYFFLIEKARNEQVTLARV